MASRQPHSWVRGEVYALRDLGVTLARLDEYEGCGPNASRPHEFQRVERVAVLDSGAAVRVWVYLYRGSIAGRREIPSGDYVE